jgi:hypothetical protein
MLVDRAVEVGPAAGDLHVGFVDELPITWCVAGRAFGVDELRWERLDPPVEGHLVDLDAAFSE